MKSPETLPSPLDAMHIADAHHHLWDLSAGSYPWLQQDYDPETFFLGDYSELRRNFLPQHYRTASCGHRVVATVHIEAERNRAEQLAETAWLHELNAAFGFPNAVVAYVALDRTDLADHLRAQTQFPLVRGIRSKPVTAKGPGESVRGNPGTMQDDAWLRGLSEVARHGLSWDMRVPSWHLEEAAEVAAAFPSLQIVLNHHGLAWDRSEEGMVLWRRGMEALAAQPNVFVKLSEFGLRSAEWDSESNAKVVREALSIFGWDRCMFGSNYPVSCLRVGFRELLAWMASVLQVLPVHQQDAVMCGNALRFYRVTSDMQGIHK